MVLVKNLKNAVADVSRKEKAMKYFIKIIVLCSSWQLNAYNAQQVAMVQQAMQANEFVNAARCDFRGLGSVLSGVNLSGAQLAGAVFDAIPATVDPQPGLMQIANQNSDLTNTNFSNATLVATSFKGATLKGANFAGADICYVDFTGADLTGAVGLDKAINARLALFCNTTMPDGTLPTGSTWTDSSGKIFYMRCASTQSSGSNVSTNSTPSTNAAASTA